VSAESIENELNGDCTFVLCGADVALIAGIYKNLLGKLKR
jgi:hypothetical protein